MKRIFEILKNRAEKGESTIIATIIESKGSVPRKSGAYMLIAKEGRIYGTIGGGKLEYNAILKGKELINKKHSYLCDYSLEQGKSELGMVCGGSALVLFYYVDCCDYEFISKGIKASCSNKPYWLVLPLGEGKAEIRYDVKDNVYKLRFNENGMEFYGERFNFDGRVYIFGGGHLAQETVPLLNHLGFSVVVVDDREEFADKELFPDADDVILLNFNDLEGKLNINKNDYIAIMTRGHLGDIDAEKFALGTSASYIGVVGSRRKTQYVRARLMEKGITEEQLDRITTPIGIDIGSETPQEIAVSIAAQLIKVRAERYK